MADEPSRPDAAEIIADECLAVRVRTLNRAVSALYDDALRPHGLRIGQLNLLVAVARMGTARPGDLCRVLSMDKSTLSRDVEVMRRNGWLEVGESSDARTRPLRLSTQGHSLLESIVPAWRQAQDKAEALIGADAKSALGQALDRLWKGRVSGH
jgi:DNA-binding MarR family transcriptional regulator